MQHYDESSFDDNTEDECSDCSRCKRCKKFKLGDRVELTVSGILSLGKRAICHGDVKGEEFNDRNQLVIKVHWDQYPMWIIGKVHPLHIQKIKSGSITFL